MKTEHRYLLAVALSFVVLLIFYSPIFNPNLARQKKITETPSELPNTVSQLPAIPEITNSEISVPEALVKQSEYREISNEIMSLKILNVNGAVAELFVKGSDAKKSGDIQLVKELNGLRAFSLQFPSELPVIYKFNQISPDGKSAVLSAELKNGLEIQKRYELIPGKSAFRVIFDIENKNSETALIAPIFVSQLYFGKEATKHEHDQIESFISPKLGKVQVAKEGKMVKKPLIVKEAIEWLALTRQYFTIITKPESETSAAECKSAFDHHVLECQISLTQEEIQPNGKRNFSFFVYAGPEYYADLKPFGEGFEQTLTQGTWGFFRYGLFLALEFCKKITGNYGFAILLMTFLIKVLFSPFTHMSFESMRKMRVIQPKMQAIQTQFKNDPTRMNKEMMELYRRHKVNPMGGCFPMLVQIPIFISFYQVLAQFVELKGESLWWIHDLTQPDRLARIGSFDINLLPILMIGTMIWQQKVTPQPAMGSPEQAKMMQWMPVIFGFMFYGLPSGLVLYWTLNNLLTVLHQQIHHSSAAPAVE